MTYSILDAINDQIPVSIKTLFIWAHSVIIDGIQHTCLQLSSLQGRGKEGGAREGGEGGERRGRGWEERW